MIAMALINLPALLIADEPTTALDVTVQAQILDLIAQLQTEFNTAVIIITHDLGIVRRFADRVYVMSQGEVVEGGATAEVFERPKHPYTRHLMSAEPKGKPPKPAPSAPVVLETENLKVWFPIKRGMLRRIVLPVAAGDTCGIPLRWRSAVKLGHAWCRDRPLAKGWAGTRARHA